MPTKAYEKGFSRNAGLDHATLAPLPPINAGLGKNRINDFDVPTRADSRYKPREPALTNESNHN